MDTLKPVKVKSIDDLMNHFTMLLRGHSRRVAICSAIMAEYARETLHLLDIPKGANLPEIAYTGGLCHDAGKLLLPALQVCPDDYLLHPRYGAELLEKNKRALFSCEIEAYMVIKIVRYHHEQPDGGGFPYGLHTKSIPLTAGICAVANSLDHRIYSEPRVSDSSAAIFNDIKVQEGHLLYESVITCFERAWPRLMEQYDKWGRFAC